MTDTYVNFLAAAVAILNAFWVLLFAVILGSYRQFFVITISGGSTRAAHNQRGEGRCCPLYASGGSEAN